MQTSDTPLFSYSIITVDAHKDLEFIHDRMPVILESDAIEAWLDPTLDDPEALLPRIARDAGPELALHPVSERVNQPAWDEPACLEPVAPAPRQQSLF